MAASTRRANGNYVILDAEGEGHYVGSQLSIHNLRMTEKWNWYGEGDDMIFVDGEAVPALPARHGHRRTISTPRGAPCRYILPVSWHYHPGRRPNWSGKISLYRYHIEDPVCFSKSIRVTIEHGHNNQRSDDYSSTAYWYQTEPHKPFDLLPVQERLPLDEV